MPGHVLVVQSGRVRTEQFWSYPAPAVGPRLHEQEYRELLTEKLEEAVRRRLMSDVPLGAMLSGGLDSSLIVAFMARHMSEPVKTFSVGFVEAGPENELPDARAVADYFGADHQQLEISYDDTVDLEELVWHLDEPVADLSSLGFLALSELAARDVKVALTGQGADELFGGYAKHLAAAITGYWQRVPGPFRRAPNALLRNAPARFRRPGRTLAAGGAAERLIAMSGRFEESLRPTLLKGAMAGLRGESAFEAVTNRLGDVPDDPLTATLHIDGQLALVDDMLHYFDRASMAHSLEVRVPFLDHELVEFAAQVPGDLKIHRFGTKYLLKGVARGLLPDWAIDKRKVGFFHGSVSSWVQAQSRKSMQNYLLVSNAQTADFIEQNAIRELVLDDAGAREHRLLLAILMLEIWLSTFLPRARSSAAKAA
jgi:asparagine synthase (glutamine-hydrolysing)